MPVGKMKSQKIHKIFQNSPDFFQNAKIAERFFDWEVKITIRKPANLVDFLQKITAAHHPEAACSIVAFEHTKGAEFSKNLQIFFRMYKFLKIFSLGGENHSEKTS